MVAQSVKSPDYKQGENRKAIRIIGLEFLVGIFLVIVILLALNYLNVLSLSQLVSSLFEKPAGQQASIEEPVSINVPADVISYSASVLGETLSEKNYNNLRAGEIEVLGEKLKTTTFDIVSQKTTGKVSLTEATSGAIMDITFEIPHSDHGELGIKNADHAFSYMSGNLQMKEGISSASLRKIEAGDVLIYETAWDNQDGTKDTRGLMISTGFPDGTTRYSLIACKLFKGSPFYFGNTCFFPLGFSGKK